MAALVNSTGNKLVHSTGNKLVHLGFEDLLATQTGRPVDSSWSGSPPSPSGYKQTRDTYTEPWSLIAHAVSRIGQYASGSNLDQYSCYYGGLKISDTSTLSRLRLKYTKGSFRNPGSISFSIRYAYSDSLTT